MYSAANWGTVASKPRLVALSALVAAAAFVNALAVAVRLEQTSDSAGGFVAGHAMAGGNILLSGWHFPINNYYFTDASPYAVLEWLLGPLPFLLVLVPALTYGLFMLAALLACLGPHRALAGNLESGSVSALLLVAPAWIGPWNPLLLSDMHVATVLGAFVALALCARIVSAAKTAVWSTVPICAGLMLITCALIASDPFCLVFAFGPAAAILAAEMLVHPAKRRIWLSVAVLATGILLGLLIPFVIAQAGGFTTETDVLTRFVPPQLFGRNLLALVTGTLTLFGANVFGMPWHPRVLANLVLRGVALAIFAAAVLRVARRPFGLHRAPLLDRMLCAGIVITILACALSAQFGKGITQQNIWSGGPPMRYLVPAFLFGSVLAGRQVSDMLAALSLPRVRNVARGTLALLAVIAAIAGGWLAGADVQPRWISGNPPTMAADWLRQHKLKQGVGEYWSANLVTAISGDAVQVRSVVPDSGRLVPYIWVEDAHWYAQSPQFVIWQDRNQTGVTWEQVRATYPVERVAKVADYRIALLSDRHQSAAKPLSPAR